MMQTTALSGNWKLACLILLSPALVTVCTAQLNWTTDGAGTTVAPTFWLEGGNNVTGNPVSSWGDAQTAVPTVSNDGTTFTQPTLATGAVNGHNAVSFAPTSVLWNDNLTGTALFGSSLQSTIFIVQQTGSGNSFSGSFDWSAVDPTLNGGLGGHQVVGLNTSSDGTVLFTYGENGTSAIQGTASGGFGTGFHIIAAQRNSGSGFISVDNLNLTTSGSFTAVDLTTLDTASKRTSAGAIYFPDGSPNSGLNGQIAEVLVFNQALGASDITQVENYLGGKYGITPVPEPSQYAMVFGLVCVVGAVALRLRRQHVTA